MGRAEPDVGPQDAPDVVQTVATSLWAAASMYDASTGYDGFCRWASVIYAAAVARHWRTRMRERRRLESLHTEPELLWAVEDGAALEDAARRHELWVKAKLCVRCAPLSAAETAVFVLRWEFPPKPYKTIARLLDMSEDAARQAYHRARERLRAVPPAWLEQEYRGDPELPPGMRVSEALFHKLAEHTLKETHEKLGAALAREQLQRMK